MSRRGRVGDVVPADATDEQLLELYGPHDGMQITAFRRLLRGEQPLTCEKCGCDDLHACEGGCAWTSLNPPVCSRCHNSDTGRDD